MPPAGPRGYEGPHLGVVAIAYAVLKIAGVVPVSSFGRPFGVRPPYFPGLLAPISEVARYSATHSGPVSLSAFLQFGAAIPLGIFTAVAVFRLRSSGIEHAGVGIALFGGMMAAISEAVPGGIVWTMGHAVSARVPAITETLHYLAVAIGGPGFTMPPGLLLAGIAVPAGEKGYVPRTIVVSGFVIAATGELS